MPDLPIGMGWPMREAYSRTPGDDYLDPAAFTPQPLSFLAQINLEEIARTGSDLPLPQAGLLLFFYDTQVQPWGFEPRDVAGTRVLFVPSGTPVEPASDPRNTPAPMRSVEFIAKEGLPSVIWMQQWLDIHPMSPVRDDAEQVRAVREELAKTDDTEWDWLPYGHAFGGWPNEVQNAMELECELASNGVSAGGSDVYRDPRRREWQTRAEHWRLLLQLETDEALGWEWGDGGTLYFWCRQQDIAAQRFDRCWTVLQCY